MTTLSYTDAELDGLRLKVAGSVHRRPANQWAPKITLGDFAPFNDPIRSTIVLFDLRRGIGQERAEDRNDTKRLWFGTHDTRNLGHMLHAPLAIGPPSTVQDAEGNLLFPNQRTIPIPNIAGGTAPISFIAEYGNENYVGFGTKVLKWNETGTTWNMNTNSAGDAPHELPGVAQGTLVARMGNARTLYLLVACGNAGYAYFDGSDWTNVTTQAANAFVWWDGRIWTIDDAGQLYKTTAPDAAWQEDAWLPLPDGYASSLFTAAITSTTATIHVVAKDGGLWSHNAVTPQFVKTSLDLPIHPDTGIGANTWIENIYIPSGLALYRLRLGGEEVPVDPIGPDRDSGLPAERSGRIIQLVPTPTSLIAVVEGESEPVQTHDLATGFSGTVTGLVHQTSRKASTLLELVRGGGWQVLWAGGQDGIASSDRPRLSLATLSPAYGKYRLWFATGTQMWYIDMPRYLVNPANLPVREYAYRAESITPWFDADLSEVLKVALNILPETRNLSMEGAELSIDIGLDNSDEFIEVVRLTESGVVEPLYFPDPDDPAEFTRAGRVFRNIRFRFRSKLGMDQKVSPDLTKFTLEFYSRLGIRQKYQFTMHVDLSQSTDHSAQEVRRRLTKIIEKVELVPFRYRSDEGDGRGTYYVKVTNEGRSMPAGDEDAKSFTMLTLLEI